MGETLRLLSLNVGSLLEPDWELRRNEVVAIVNQHRPDVFCLQEIWQSSIDNTTAHWVRDQLDDRYEIVFGGHGFAPFSDENPSFAFGSAILSRWPIETSNQWRLPVADDPDDPFPAMIPWEMVHARTAGLDVFTVHLAPAPTHGRHRRLQVLEMDRLIRAQRGSLDQLEMGSQRTAMPPLLTGDFNAEPDSDEIRFLKGLTVLDDRTTFFQDAWAVAGDDGPGYTSDWRTHPLSAALNIHRKRIDYIFVGDQFRRAGDAGRVLACEVIANEPITGVQASDHRGLLAEIVWPTRPEMG
jgi:endonuclease/exonuclease/phosphatase family metal-dependent hydrolase